MFLKFILLNYNFKKRKTTVYQDKILLEFYTHHILSGCAKTNSVFLFGTYFIILYFNCKSIFYETLI